MPDPSQPELFTDNEFVDDLSQPGAGPGPFTTGLNPDQLDAVVHADGPAAGRRRRRLGQDAGAHAPHRPPDRPGCAAVEHPRHHVHQQGRGRDARARRPASSGRWSRRCGCRRSTRRACASSGATPRRSATRARSRSTTRPTPCASPATSSATSASTPSASRRAACTATSRCGRTSSPTRRRRLPNARDIFARKHADVYAEYQARLHKAGAMDFDDLLLNVVKLFREHPDVLEHYRQRFQHILVDEFQDTNQAQNEIVLLLAGGHHNVCVVGDSDQGVYGWRGADLRNILQFEDAFPEVTTIVLDQNYRSTQTILDAANAVIENNVERKPKSLWTDTGMGDRIVRYHAEDEGDEAMWVAGTAQQLHRDDAINWREIAVLYRTNAQSRVIEEAFMRMGVPYKVVGGTRFYDRREVKDAMAYLRALVNPADEVSVKRVLNVPKRGVGDASVARLDEFARDRGRAVPRGDAARRGGRRHRAGPPRDRLVRRPARLAARDGRRRRRRARRPAPGGDRRLRLPRRARGGGHVEAHGRIENLGELVGSAREFTVLDEFLEQVVARGRHRRARRRRSGRADDAALGQGPRVPGGVHRRRRGGRVPAQPGAHRARRDGGGAPSRVRRHHAGDAAAVHLARLEPDAVRQHPVQPAVAVPRRDPEHAGRGQGQRRRAARRTAARATAPATTAATATRRRTARGARRRRRPQLRRAPRPRRRGGDASRGAQRSRSRPTRKSSACGSATTSPTRRSARA